MALPPGWRRLSPSEKAEVRRLYLRAMRGGTNSAATRRLYDALRGKTRDEVLDILTAAGNEYATGRVAQLRQDAQGVAQLARKDITSHLIVGAASRGRLPRTGSLGDRAADWIAQRVASPRQSYRVSPIEGPSSSRLFRGGDVWLSKNLHRTNSRGVIDGLRKALEEGARHAETASSLAQRLRDEVGHRVSITDKGPEGFKIPQQLRAIEREAYAAIRASGDPRAAQRFASIRQEFESYARKLGTGQKGHSALAMDALRKIDAALARNDAKAVDSAVKWWTWNREQEHQRLIARTEMSRTYSRAYVEASRGIPWIVAWEWNTDDNPCEECAALGGQVFTRGDMPELPAHPNCECYWTEIVDSSREPTESEWEHMLDEEAA
jgi:hypothetical protein